MLASNRARSSTSKPHIAVCIRNFEYGGQGTVVENEFRHLQNYFDLTLVAEKIQRSVPAPVEVVESRPLGKRLNIDPDLVDLLRSASLIHCHDSLGLMVAARASGTPTVITSHGIAPPRLRGSLKGAAEALTTQLVYPRLYRSATRVVAISEYIASWIRRCGVEPMTICNGTTMPTMSSVMVPSRQLLYVGEVSKRKGVADLLTGVGNAPKEFTLGIVGKGDVQDFLERSRVSDIAQRVTNYGVLPEARLWSLYARAFCTVSASCWEGFGLPILEGFAFGRPAIVRRTGGMQELVEESGAGVCFDDPQEIPLCINLVERNWASFSKRATSYAQGRTWDRVFHRYRELFDDVIEGRALDGKS